MKVGIVGCGGIAQQNHIPIWKKLGIKLVGIDRNDKLLYSLKAKYGLDTVYVSLEEALEKEEDLTILDICTPVQSHVPLSLLGLEKGVNVLVEKPMATNYNDALTMVKLAENKKLKLGVIHNSLFNPFYMKIKQILHKMDGDIVRVDIKYVKRHDDPWVLDEQHWSHSLELGIFTEILAHPLYFLRDLLGDDLKVSFASLEKIYSYGKNPWLNGDELLAILKNSKNSIGTVTISLNSNRTDVLLTIYTSKGILECSLWRGLIFIQGSMHYGPMQSIKDNIKLMYHIVSSMGRAFHLGITNKLVSGQHYLIPDFYNAVLMDRKPLVSGIDGLQVAKLIESITKEIGKNG